MSRQHETRSPDPTTDPTTGPTTDPTTDPTTALVLGGSSDIGWAVLRRLAGRGLAHAVLAVRDPAAVERRLAAEPLGLDRVDVVAWDALDPDGHQPMVDDVLERVGRLDLVLCAVGLLGHHAGLAMGPGQVDLLSRTNHAGPAAALAVVGRALAAQGSGTIVVLSSVAAVRARRSNFVYGASKAALDAFAQGLGDALVDAGVQVHVVRPGFVRTSMTRGLDPAPFASDPDEVAEAVVSVLGARRSRVVWVPRLLGPLFAVLGVLPRPLWQRVAGDR